MSTNIELKCRLANRGDAETALREMGARLEWTRQQRDTFFGVARGWLKLREEAGATPRLIAYERSTDDAGLRASDYELRELDDAEAWLRLLGRVLPRDFVVEKERTLWLHGHTRVHLDRVRDLGEFLELETVVEGITDDEAQREAERMVTVLGLDPADFIAVPYRDLLAMERDG